ncbi:hypothetical protein [Nocardioides sp.]|uniref:hypothetical protein n=1 Tax=Nocardioides sp. TaxID=35761 RepID=UPI002B26E906|nr:hypothetical protein [Nocardioides sp.]
MTADWSVPAWVVLATLGAVLLLVLGGLLVVARLRRAAVRTDGEVAAARAESELLRTQVQAIEQRLSATAAARTDLDVEQHEYVITNLGDKRSEDDGEPAPAVDGPLFADLVLRESVVQAASLAAGLRRALAPEHLNRIRFEMRRELKRARKQRRADARQARREYEARHRSGEAGEAAA